jgi:hypothetical protein
MVQVLAGLLRKFLRSAPGCRREGERLGEQVDKRFDGQLRGGYNRGDFLKQNQITV